MFENVVYAGIPQLLSRLVQAGKRLYIATSKPEPFARTILDHFSLRQPFTFVGGSTLDSSRVKKADVIAYVLQANSIPPQDAVMVGDRAHDIVGAAANQLDAVGVLYGYGSDAELRQAGAKFLAASPEELAALL